MKGDLGRGERSPECNFLFDVKLIPFTSGFLDNLHSPPCNCVLRSPFHIFLNTFYIIKEIDNKK